jgi:hypothetical protein
MQSGLHRSTNNVAVVSTVSPSTDNTFIPSAAPSSETEQRIEYFSFVKAILQNKQVLIEKEIFSTPDISVYTFDGFMKTLESQQFRPWYSEFSSVSCACINKRPQAEYL